MLFSSIDFALFLPVVFVLYWLVARRSVELRNAFVILAGCVFYGWWDWRFLGLLFFTAGTDYLVALGMERSGAQAGRRALMALSLVANLGLLFFFKYYDFFVHSFVQAFAFMGRPIDARPLGLVLPVGISFYTFQSLSYTFDVYRRKLPAVHEATTFFAFVSFFPQLLAGPIERAHHMLPQFSTKRVFDAPYAYDGVRQMLWGLFKKVVVADNCALIVDPVFADHTAYGGSTLFLAVVLFAFQIYGDFSGYSDIAIGCARLFGFELMRNFAHPYFSRDIPEFWRRWHISLSTWFRDYLYIPLGGSRGSRAATVRNVMVIFLVSGFWHGANWTFLVWGGLNGLFFLPALLRGTHHVMSDTVAEGRLLPSLREVWWMLTTFLLTCLAWTFFRAFNIGQAIAILSEIGSYSLFTVPGPIDMKHLAFAALGIGITLIIEWFSRDRQYGLQLDGRLPRMARLALYYGLILVIFRCAPVIGGEFIYFQF